MTKDKRVAIIGAGPAGAITTDAFFKEQAFDTIRVFERQSRIGGTWVHNVTPDSGIPSLQNLLEGKADKTIDLPTSYPCSTPMTEKVNSFKERFSDTGSHENLHSNLPPEIMCFTQEPIAQELSNQTLKVHGPDSPFRHREVINKWVEDIFERGDYRQLVELETTVELAEKRGDEWTLTLRKPDPANNKNYWWQESFDALVVATGHYYVPYIPDIPVILEYNRKFPGRIQHSKHYSGPETFRNKRVVVVGGSVSAFDSLHDIRRVAKSPVISSLRKPSSLFGEAPFTHPDIENRGQIAAFDAENDVIKFADGTSTNGADTILFATGYDFSFPFLPTLGAVQKRVPGLYEHVFKIDDPSLAFIGMVTGGFGIRIFEWQAVAAARVLSGHASLPSQRRMKRWEKDRLDERGEGVSFWTLMPDFERYFEQLRSIAGDPARGTTGRVLPEYEAQWAESFWRLIRYRVEWWQREATRAASKQSQL
ncbi:dimethylaniline monooxygenase [Penicillium angulare]|uniref:Dimethylaniline monooxygenase n=1 Tax=Penicillium angulare TaxID=116970 RepID=A0A9W9FX42_9EURO|nr:dimethylaniline monooxygenase [Penicillium angulare]